MHYINTGKKWSATLLLQKKQTEKCSRRVSFSFRSTNITSLEQVLSHCKDKMQQMRIHDIGPRQQKQVI